MFIQDFPRSTLVRTSRPICETRTSRQLAAAVFAMIMVFSSQPVTVAAEVEAKPEISSRAMQKPDANVRARLLVAKGAAVGGVLGIAVQLGLAISLAPAVVAPTRGSSRQPERPSRVHSSRTAPSPSTPEVPVRPIPNESPAVPDYSKPERRHRRKRQPGSRQMIMPKGGTPINISINTYPYFPSGVQPMPWQMPAEGFRNGMPSPPAVAPIPLAEPMVHTAVPAASEIRSPDSRPVMLGAAFTGPQPRGHAAVSRDTNSAVWEQGFERVHRPTPPHPIADDSSTVGSIEGMMKTIIAENLSLRG